MLYASRACLWLVPANSSSGFIGEATVYECGTYDELEDIHALPVGAITAAHGLTATVTLAIVSHIVAAVALGAVVSTRERLSSPESVF